MTDSLDLRSDPLYLKVYTLLKSWIVEGRLLPGAPLKETTLAAELNVSRTPIRDALRRLEQDRLIVHVSSGGAYEVYQPTREEIADLYMVRAVLESGAAGLAASRRPPEQMEAMAATLPEMAAAYDRDAIAEIVDLDTRFHELLVSASGNPVLVELHARLSTRLLHARIMMPDLKARKQVVLGQHEAILDAVRSGDSASAADVTRDHVMHMFSFAESAFVQKASGR